MTTTIDTADFTAFCKSLALTSIPTGADRWSAYDRYVAARQGQTAAAAAPAPTVTTPIPGLAQTFGPDLTAPLSLYGYATHPSGLWKTNLWFGSDGDNHLYNGVTSVWPDSAGSRAGGADDQTYSDAAYNGVNPFATGPDGVSIAIARNPNPADPLTPNPYTGGALTTQNSFKQRYGYFEADVTPPAVKGSWPAFWLLGEPYTPYEADEIDIAEFLGGTPGQVYQNAHSPDHLKWDAPAAQAPFAGPRVTVGFLWTPDTFGWFVNGQQTASCANPGFHTPMYLILNHAVGPKTGGWATLNMPVSDAALPARFTVHGVRAWRLPS